MSVEEFCRRAPGDLLAEIAEAMYDASAAEQSRFDAPPWLGLSDDERRRWKAMARIAVGRAMDAFDELLERLLDGEGILREQVQLQSRRIAELEHRAPEMGDE